jgi:predicted nucleic-acid-binding Zn-ribbon protein
MFVDGNDIFHEQINTETGKVIGCVNDSYEYMECKNCAYNECPMRGKVFDVWNKNGGIK